MRRLLVYINSKYRNNYFNTSASNFIYEFPTTIRNIISMRLHAFCVPKSWYNISKYIGNTKFTIIARKRDSKTLGKIPQFEKEIEIEIPEGNWSAAKLVRYLNNNFLCNSSIKWLSHVTAIFDENTKKIGFNIVSKDKIKLNNTIDLIFYNNKNNIMYGLGWLMGFRMGAYKNIYRNIIQCYR